MRVVNFSWVSVSSDSSRCDNASRRSATSSSCCLRERRSVSPPPQTIEPAVPDHTPGKTPRAAKKVSVRLVRANAVRPGPRRRTSSTVARVKDRSRLTRVVLLRGEQDRPVAGRIAAFADERERAP